MAIYPKCDHTLYGVLITETKTLSNTFALISIGFCFSLSSFQSWALDHHVVITIVTMIITRSITWRVPTSLSLHTLSKCLKINKDYYYYYYVLCVSTLFLYKKAENKYRGDPSTCQTHFDYTTPWFRYILYTLHFTHTYILDYAEYCLRHDKLKRLKCFQSWLISLCDISWKRATIKNHFKTLCCLSHCGMWDGRVWVPFLISLLLGEFIKKI